MIRVVTYRRVSTEDQANNDLSLPAQSKAMARWLAERPDHKFVQEFSDEGVSAYAPADQRPGFQEMIKFCLKNHIDVLLVHKLDRFSRDRRECAIFKELLSRKEVKVRSVSEDFDPDTAQGVLLEGILETLAQFFSMNLSSEVLKGMQENAERGWFNGGSTPFGYKVVKVQQGAREYSRLEPGDDSEIALIREIFELAAEQGKGCRAIAVILNHRKVPSPGGGTWSPGRIGSILNNPVYAGDSVWRRSKKRGRTGRQRTTREDWIVVPDTHTALVPREQYDRYQKLAASRPFPPTKGQPDSAPDEPVEGEVVADQDAAIIARKATGDDRPVKNLLAGMIRCCRCGHVFYGVVRGPRRKGNRAPRPVYMCRGYLSRGTSVCTSLAVPKEWIESAVLGHLRDRLCTPDGKAAIREAVTEHIERRRRAYTTDQASLQRGIADCQRRIQNFYRAIGDGLEPAVCRQHIADLTEKKSGLEAELELMVQEDIYSRALTRNQALLDDFSNTFAASFDQLSLHRRREIVRRFVTGIEVHEPRLVRVHYRVPFDPSGLKTLLTAPLDEDAGGIGGHQLDPEERARSLRHSDPVRGAARDQSDTRETAVVTWSVDHTVPEWSQLYPTSIREDEPILAEHAEILERRARSVGWRSLVPPRTAGAAKAGMQAGDGFDRLAERRARLALRLERDRTWTRELAGGATVRQIAEREGVTGPLIHFEVLFARLDEEITAELLRPGSWAAALSNEALREVAQRKTPEAQARLFWPLVEQIQRKVGVDRSNDAEICASP